MTTHLLDPHPHLIHAAALSLLLFAACAGDDPVAPVNESSSSENAAGPSAPTPALDPGSLKFIMSGLGTDMTRLSAGLWVDDFDAIRVAAVAVADHPHVSPTELGRVRGTLGERLPAFVAADRAVHDAAQRVAQAAEARDMERVLQETATLQSGCVSCHAQFREALKVD
jgi:hypothetical protein